MNNIQKSKLSALYSLLQENFHKDAFYYVLGENIVRGFPFWIKFWLKYAVEKLYRKSNRLPENIFGDATTTNKLPYTKCIIPKYFYTFSFLLLLTHYCAHTALAFSLQCMMCLALYFTDQIT